MSRFWLSGSAAALLWCTVLAGAEMPPPVVSVDTVKMVSETEPRRYVGAVETIRRVDLMPRITGNLLKIHFTEGGLVEAGDLLYELEDTTYRAAVDALRAEKEVLEASLRYADTEYKRSSTLLQSRAVAVSSHDKAELEINSAKSRIKQLEASLTDAENTLSYTRIYAPISGRIGKSNFTEGNLITPQGGSLNDIEMVAPIYVRFSLSERVFRRDFGGADGIRQRGVVRIQLADDTIYGEEAQITLVDNKINGSTNTITLWATFPNRDRQLIPGGFVTVLLGIRNEKKMPAVVPSALIAAGDGYSVYVLDRENRVQRRAVKTGKLADGVQIIESGLDGSERVIIDGMHKTAPGERVTVSER